MFLIKEEKEKTYPLNKVVFHGGVEGIKRAIHHLEKMGVDPKLVGLIKTTFQDINSRPLNQIASSHVYKRHIEKHLHFPLENPAGGVKDLILKVENDMNHLILTSKRGDTRTKRLKEKNQIILFYKTQKDQLKQIFDLQNLFLQAKDKLDEGP